MGLLFAKLFSWFSNEGKRTAWILWISRVWQTGNFVMTIFISLPMIFQVVMLSSQFKNKVSETLVNHFAFESSKPFTESSFSIDPDEKIASFSI